MDSRGVLFTVVCCVLLCGSFARCPKHVNQEGPATLPDLPYPPDALEPCIDAATMQLHHDILHRHYVDSLNMALKDEKELSNEKLDRLVRWVGTRKLPKHLDVIVRRNAGGAWNHNLFWKMMMPQSQAKDPNDVLSKDLMSKIEKEFGSMDEMKANFTEKALVDVFGSGWVWLCAKNRHGDLMMTWTQNQDNPLMYGVSAHHSKPCIPILGLDMWEHAFLLKYQINKGDYVNCFWSIVNWEQVNKNYEDAMKFFEMEMNKHVYETAY